MIRYIFFTTGLLTFTYLDGNIVIYLAENSIQYTEQNWIYDILCLIHSIFDLNSSTQEFPRLLALIHLKY